MAFFGSEYRVVVDEVFVREFVPIGPAFLQRLEALFELLSPFDRIIGVFDFSILWPFSVGEHSQRMQRPKSIAFQAHHGQSVVAWRMGLAQLPKIMLGYEIVAKFIRSCPCCS